MAKSSRKKSEKRRKSKRKAEAQRMLPGPEVAAMTATAESDAASWPVSDVFGSGQLLERCRTHWQYGEWAPLRALTEAEVAQDRDRGKLAALLAAEASHSGDAARARQFMRLARDWGCSPEILSRLMISAASNTLGRAALALGEDATAERHFRSAITLIEPHADAGILGRVRHIRAAADLGLRSEAARLFEASVLDRPEDRPLETSRERILGAVAGDLAGLSSEAAPGGDAPAPAAPVYPGPPPALKDVAGFSEAGHRALWEAQGPRLYIDSKSLPRSGLHYFRDTLQHILGEDFSFCEWYTEPGCCGMSPCTIPFGRKEGPFSLRLIKSHDFELKDPAYPLGRQAVRVVLTRDPLFILTSWWMLQTLYSNADLLQSHGIRTVKINFQHESQVVDRAYQLVTEQGVMPSSAALRNFLKGKSDYIVRFLQKWTAPELVAEGLVSVHDYADMAPLILSLLAPWESQMSDDARFRFRRFALRAGSGFHQRDNAFLGRTPELTAHLQAHAAEFRQAADDIRRRAGL